MKVKVDFITNSSSASFVIPKTCITEKQISLIYSHIEMGHLIAKNEELHLYFDKWKITETEDQIEGYTSMDNFDIEWYLKKIGVPEHCIIMSGSNYDEF